MCIQNMYLITEIIRITNKMAINSEIFHDWLLHMWLIQKILIEAIGEMKRKN